MNERTANIITVVSASFIGLVFLSWWLFYNPVGDLEVSTPGRDNRPADFRSQTETVEIGALFASFDGVPSEIEGSWPRFRGADFDNIDKENTDLLESWGDAGPNILWSVDVGEGHAGPVISDGRVYLMDYNEEEGADLLRCFSFDDGTEIWRRGYEVEIKRNHGMSRTVPAVKDNYVVTMGPKCQVMCVDADSGNFMWGIDLESEYGTEVPLWYTGQCPLIDDSLAVIAVGGEAMMIGVDLETGNVVWETPNPHSWKMSHSSVMPFTIHGKKMYVYSSLGGVVGVSAEKEDAGQILFESTLWSNNVIAPSPIYLGDGKLFFTAGYGAGSMMLKINEEAGSYSVESLQKITPTEGLASEQQTPIYYDGYLFSILPKDAGPMRNQFVCTNPDDVSDIVWSSGTTNRFGLGPFILADNKFYILSDDGVLTVAEARTDEYVQLGQTRILDGVDAWGPLALVSGRLLARDSQHLVCVDLRGQSI